jgi:hypothetical protein
LTGYAPALAQPQAITPAVGSVTLTGSAPGIAQPRAVTPAVGSVALTGYTPGIAQPQTITPAVGFVALTGYAPSTAGVVQISPAEGVISVVGAPPMVIQAVVFRAKLTPDVWLKTLIDEIMAVPLPDEVVRFEHQPEEHIILEMPDSDITTRQGDYLHVTVVPESYFTTMAEELYFVASELVL